ncbi:hypothetical protein BDW60DRAFT_216868 [Aspergillus nidulans var. acristatus]
MSVTASARNPPPLSELAPIITRALQQNFAHASASVTQCPDLRKPPYGLAAPGLSGTLASQIPNFNAKYSLLSLARDMEMSAERGFVLGAGAASFQDIGHNAELAPNVAWQAREGVKELALGDPDCVDIINKTHVIEVVAGEADSVNCRRARSTNCALMVNLFGSRGLPGPVLKITARGRTGPANFTNAIRAGLFEAYGDSHPISMGGVVLLKAGKARFHVMPDFPAPEDLPFKDRRVLEQKWLKYHTCEAPVVCLTIFHSADPEGLQLRMEHTHCFDLEGSRKGGHYHYDLETDSGGEVEYEAYLNTAVVSFVSSMTADL